jgi:hypothetical protein
VAKTTDPHQAEIDVVLEEMVSAAPGKGNEAIHLAGIKLKGLGLSGSEASARIQDKARFMRSPEDRIRDARRIV